MSSDLLPLWLVQLGLHKWSFLVFFFFETGLLCSSGWSGTNCVPSLSVLPLRQNWSISLSLMSYSFTSQAVTGSVIACLKVPIPAVQSLRVSWLYWFFCKGPWIRPPSACWELCHSFSLFLLKVTLEHDLLLLPSPSHPLFDLTPSPNHRLMWRMLASLPFCLYKQLPTWLPSWPREFLTLHNRDPATAAACWWSQPLGTKTQFEDWRISSKLFNCFRAISIFTWWTPLTKQTCHPYHVDEDCHRWLPPTDTFISDGSSLVACSTTPNENHAIAVIAQRHISMHCAGKDNSIGISSKDGHPYASQP